MLSDIVAGTVNEFIDWAMLAVVFLLIYYIVKFFTVEGPTKEEKEAAEEERKNKFRGFVTEKTKKLKEKGAKKKKKDLVSPIKENLKRCIDSCDEMVSILDQKEKTKVHGEARNFNKQIHLAWRNLRLLRTKTEGEEREVIDKLVHQTEAIRQMVEEELKGKIPKQIGSDWKAKVAPIRAKVMAIRGALGAIWKRLDEFHQ